MSYASWKAAEAARRGDEAAARFWLGVRESVDHAPPLSDEQRDRLVVLLRPTGVLTTAGARRPPQAA